MRKVLLLGLLLIAPLQGCSDFELPYLDTNQQNDNVADDFKAENGRSSKVVFADRQIEKEARLRIDALIKDEKHINLTSFNRRVLITGEIPSASANADIAKIVSDIKQVREVRNELILAEPSTHESRSKDSLITANVYSQLAKNPKSNVGHIKLVTESGTVYLLGSIRLDESKVAANIAKTTEDVQNVVSLFEITNQ